MRFSILFLFLLCSPTLFSQDYLIPETVPVYKNGDLAVFLDGQLRYPQEAMDQKIKGAVLVAFTVNSSGLVAEPEVISNIGAGCGEEALRLISLSSGQWTPAIQDGKYVSARMHQRITFDPAPSSQSGTGPQSAEVKEGPKVKNNKKERTREDRVQTLFNLGMKNFSEEKYSKARHYFQQVLSLNPGDENTVFNLALTKAKLKDVDGACEDLRALADKGSSDAAEMLAKVCK